MGQNLNVQFNSIFPPPHILRKKNHFGRDKFKFVDVAVQSNRISITTEFLKLKVHNLK